MSYQDAKIYMLSVLCYCRCLQGTNLPRMLHSQNKLRCWLFLLSNIYCKQKDSFLVWLFSSVEQTANVMIGMTHQTGNLFLLPVFKIYNSIKPFLHKYFPHAFCFLWHFRTAAFLTSSALFPFFFQKTADSLYIHVGSVINSV